MLWYHYLALCKTLVKSYENKLALFITKNDYIKDFLFLQTMHFYFSHLFPRNQPCFVEREAPFVNNVITKGNSLFSWLVDRMSVDC